MMPIDIFNRLEAREGQAGGECFTGRYLRSSKSANEKPPRLYIG